MEIIHIKDQLENLGVNLDDINYGFFDDLGEVCAKRRRDPKSDGYKEHGAFYRANYERGILIYYLVQKYQVSSMLEIGFGRGYGTICALMGMAHAKIDGKVTTIDPILDEMQLNKLAQLYPEVATRLHYMQGTSKQAFESGTLDIGGYDMAYIDGDHSEAGVRYDCEHVVPITNKVILFDDYHLEETEEHIRCKKAIDEVEGDKVLIRMDRRLFLDERQYTDEQINYGQVLIIK